jgi:hypothetical protein
MELRLYAWHCTGTKILKIRSNTHKTKPFSWGLSDSITQLLRAQALGSDCLGSWSLGGRTAGNSLKMFPLHNLFPIQLSFQMRWFTEPKMVWKVRGLRMQLSVKALPNIYKITGSNPSTEMRGRRREGQRKGVSQNSWKPNTSSTYMYGT